MDGLAREENVHPLLRECLSNLPDITAKDEELPVRRGPTFASINLVSSSWLDSYTSMALRPNSGIPKRTQTTFITYLVE